MKALITLNGIAAIDKPVSVMNIECANEKQLVTKLKELQSAYSIDGKDRPKIQKFNIPTKKDPSKTRKVIDCSTQADWHHVAHINVSSSTVSTEIL